MVASYFGLKSLQETNKTNNLNKILLEPNLQANRITNIKTKQAFE